MGHKPRNKLCSDTVYRTDMNVHRAGHYITRLLSEKYVTEIVKTLIKYENLAFNSF